MFSHAKYSTDIQESKYIIWDRTPVNNNDEIVFYTDTSLQRVNPSVRKKYAWLLESVVVTGQMYEMIKYSNRIFENVFTYDKELLDRGENYRFSPTGGCWIYPEDQRIHEKSKLISMILSGKDWSEGHKLRQEIYKNVKNGIDYFGRGTPKPVDNKIECFKDYMFSIIIENGKKDYYFSEKLIDCLRTGTVPIYWGFPSVDKFFDERGFIIFNNFEQLKKIISNLTPELYQEKLEYVKINFEKSEEFLMSEDYIYKNYFLGR